MNTKQLKAKVLDLAIHGKLLSPETVAELKKSPDYETADVLLEKIRKEKEEKIAKGELKRDKKDSYIFVGDDKRHYEKFADGTVKDIEDEIPFDVPEGWAWSRLSNICNIIGGVSYNKNDVAQTGIKILRGGNIQDGKIIECDDDIFIPVSYKNSTNSVYKNDIVLVASTGSSLLIGKTGFTKRTIENTQIGAFLRILRTTHFCNAEFINSIFLSDYYKNYIRNLAKGTNINNVKTVYLTNFLIPLPPSNEQYEIIIVLNSFFEKVEYLESNKTELQKTIAKTKSKILDLAIHGKLVPQDPNDEPASVLLEKLRAEKEDKIAKGELKRDKNDSYIYKGSDNCYYQRFADGREEDISDEIPFEVPSNWTWTRIGAISNKITDGEHNTPKKVSTFQGFYLLSARNIQNGYISLNDVDYVDEDEFLRIHKRCNPQKGDVLISCSGSVGRCTVIEDNNKYVMVRSAAMISSTVINTKYLMYVIQSQELQNQIEDSSKQTAQANLFQAAIADLLIPLPPSNEQNRIINKIEELYIKLELIMQNID